LSTYKGFQIFLFCSGGGKRKRRARRPRETIKGFITAKLLIGLSSGEPLEKEVGRKTKGNVL